MRDLSAEFAALRGALKENEPSASLAEAIIAVLETIVSDVGRAADALEMLSKKMPASVSIHTGPSAPEQST